MQRYVEQLLKDIAYYPYHLDAKYDDEHGRPYDYGLGLGDEDDRDDW